MSSQFSWVDFSNADRDLMLNVVRLFSEPETRDELGVGSIRDGIADYFFPGTSTIQRRARYFLFIPWIYLSLEKKKVRSAEISNKARSEEIRLIKALKDNNETDGLIGILAGEELKRLPSNIYWNGLGSWGIRNFPGSQYHYHRYLDDYYHKKSTQIIGDDKEPVAGRLKGNWHPGLPKIPDDMYESATFKLTIDEAEYLKERILSNHRKSVLAYSILFNNDDDADYLWDHPIVETLSEKLQGSIAEAKYFAITINGAALLYNLILAEMKESADMIDEYNERIKEWSSYVATELDGIKDWTSNLASFWDSEMLINARVPHGTKVFVDEWLRIIIKEGNYNKIEKHEEARELVAYRERRLKKSRSRIDNQRAREIWKGDAGTGVLDYRWGISKIIINDIVSGINGNMRK